MEARPTSRLADNGCLRGYGTCQAPSVANRKVPNHKTTNIPDTPRRTKLPKSSPRPHSLRRCRMTLPLRSSEMASSLRLQRCRLSHSSVPKTNIWCQCRSQKTNRLKLMLMQKELSLLLYNLVLCCTIPESLFSQEFTNRYCKLKRKKCFSTATRAQSLRICSKSARRNSKRSLKWVCRQYRWRKNTKCLSLRLEKRTNKN